MKSFEQLSEDLATRRAELKQRQREQGAAFKSKGADIAAAGKAKTDALKQRTSDDSGAALDRIKQRAKAKAAADRERKAKQAERDDISAEIPSLSACCAFLSLSAAAFAFALCLILSNAAPESSDVLCLRASDFALPAAALSAPLDLNAAPCSRCFALSSALRVAKSSDS